MQSRENESRTVLFAKQLSNHVAMIIIVVKPT